MLIPVRNQGEFDQLVKQVDWNDAFIKEAYYYCPATVRAETGGIMEAESRGLLGVLVLTPNPQSPGIELHFNGVQEVCLPTASDVNPRAEVRSWKIEFSFNDSMATGGIIIADLLRFEMLGSECWKSGFHIAVERIRAQFDLLPKT